MKRRTVWIVIAAVAVSIVLSFAFLIDKVTVSASTIVLSEKGWTANFSVPLKAKAIENGDVYLVDQQGRKSEGILTLASEGHSIEVTGLKPGSYTLHISRDAIKGGFLKSLATTKLSFTVQTDIQSVKSEKDLKNYFEQVKKMMAQHMNGMAVEESESQMSMDTSSAAPKSSGEANEYSKTNNQVEGVDEADQVKTDGDYIYSIVNGRVIITDIRDPSAMAKIAELPYEATFYPSQLFLNETTLIVLGDQHIPYNHSDTTEINSKRVMMPYTSSTHVRFYDIKERQSPKLVREIGAEGYLNGARKTDDMLYFITNVMPNYWAFQDGFEGELRPFTYDSQNGDQPLPMPYSDLSILPGTLEATYSVITAMDLNNPKEAQVVTKGYLGGSNAMYMSKESLYLTAPIYIQATEDEQNSTTMMWNPQETNTEIFKFSLNGTKVDFVSSGEVEGMLLNQFSMDEHNNYFRVVTTKGFAWNEDTPSENNLFILDAGMKQVGSIEGLAKGERIYSARFMGDKAYMVTFKETDPLFVMDVSIPTAPKVLGELKIPGFSNYLHPLDENHLIGFGYDTTSVPSGNGSQPTIITEGMKISLFDVSDFNNPKEKDVEIIGSRGTYSSLQYDHKALFQHQQKGLYGFPITVYEGANKEGYGEFSGEGAMIYEITTEKGIEEVANLINYEKSKSYEDWENAVQRIMYVGEIIYTISPKEIKSYDLNTFKAISSVSY